MSVLGNIRPIFFFFSFTIGLLICYVMTPPPQVVVKFPTPFNAGHITYKDKADTCFRFDASKVACPRDKSVIRMQPLAEDFRQKQTQNK